MNTRAFEGDLLLIDTPDGGDLVIENDAILGDPAIATAVYLSLCGGNKEDNGKVKNSDTWWGNTLDGVAENEKIVSRFQSVITGMPMSTNALRVVLEMAGKNIYENIFAFPWKAGVYGGGI